MKEKPVKVRDKMIAQEERDVRGLIFIALAVFFLLLPSAGNVFLHEKGDHLKSTNDLRWDAAHDRLVADAEVLPARLDKVPGHIAPLFFQKIPVNRADAQLLETVSGIGPELASRIIRERDEHGKFRTTDDLMRVAGIGMKRKEQLTKYLHFD